MKKLAFLFTLILVWSDASRADIDKTSKESQLLGKIAFCEALFTQDKISAYTNSKSDDETKAKAEEDLQFFQSASSAVVKKHKMSDDTHKYYLGLYWLSLRGGSINKKAKKKLRPLCLPEGEYYELAVEELANAE